MRNGRTVISTEEAEIIREIFKAYLDGASLKAIAEELTGRQIPYESVSSGDGIEAHESEFMTLSQEAELLKQRITAIQESTAKDNGEQNRLEQIQAIIAERESKCMEYDDSIVRQMVECIKVYPGGKLEIIFGGGYLVEESV